MPPMQVSMTDDPTFHAQLEFNLFKLRAMLSGEPASEMTPEKMDLLETLKAMFKELKQGVEIQHKDTATLLIYTAEATIHMSTGLGWGGLVTGMFRMTITPLGASTREEEIGRTIEGGAGGGLSFRATILGCGVEAYGMLIISVLINLGSGSAGLGLAAQVGFRIGIRSWLTVDINTEAKGTVLFVPCRRLLGSPPTLQDAPLTTWGVFQFTVAIDVCICLVVDISIEESWETSSKFNNGPCELEEFGTIP
ncbi:hypothetical protein B0J13DRAFT_657352 [Dactylonectria estremocensis]|uniref:Uncharacterized protein n=1 Tax=Dactylonectria estremocensis TaxID=1079267 RepID=A0A9P9D690_9HYPO|nr:hypothetical protein B0J13DRAFT_657352 [Dactylonectria estremocensis]